MTATPPKATIARCMEIIAGHAGLEPPEWVVAARVADRVRALGLSSAHSYAQLLTAPTGAGELSLLVETLRVGETRFFRHRSHIRALEKFVVPALAQQRGRRVRVWSAGCASGEEAYTLAILLGKELGCHNVRVLGTDISTRALAEAEQATYPASAVADIPAGLRDWAFEDGDGDQEIRVTGPVRRAVAFERHNLAEDRYPRGFDLILCRNVLIYFTPKARAEVVDRLAASLVEGGFLFVGYAESLRDHSALEAVRTPDAVLYRKWKTRTDPTPVRPPVPAPATPARPESPAAPDPDPGGLVLAPDRRSAMAPEEAVLELSGRYDDGERLTRELQDTIVGRYRRVVIDIDGAEYLGDEAANVLRRALATARHSRIDVVVEASRPGPLRWLRRTGLAPGEDA